MNSFDAFFPIALVLALWAVWMLVVLFLNRVWRRRPSFSPNDTSAAYNGLLFRLDGSVRTYGGFGDRGHPDHPGRNSMD